MRIYTFWFNSSFMIVGSLVITQVLNIFSYMRKRPFLQFGLLCPVILGEMVLTNEVLNIFSHVRKSLLYLHC